MHFCRYLLLIVSVLVSTTASYAQVNWIRNGVGGGHLVFSPDGKLLASITGERVVTVWNLEQSKPLRVFDIPYDSLKRTFHLSFSSSGDSLLLCRGDYWFRTYDLDVTSSKIVRNSFFQFHVPFDYNSRTFTDFSGRNFAFLNYSPSDILVIGNVESGIVDTLLLSTSSGSDMHLYAGGSRVSVMGSDSTIRIYDLGTKQEILKITEPKVLHESFIFEPANSIAVLSTDSSLMVYDLTTGSLRYEFSRKIDPGSYFHGISSSRSSLAALYSSRDSLITIVDIESGTVINDLKMDRKIGSVTFSSNDDQVGIALNDGPLLLYTTDTWQLLDTLTGEAEAVTALTFSKRTGALLAGGSSILYLDPLTGTLSKSFNTGVSQVDLLSLSPSEKYLAVSGSGSRIWDLENDTFHTFTKYRSGTSAFKNVQFFTDSTFLYTFRYEDHYPWDCGGASACGLLQNDSMYAPSGFAFGLEFIDARIVPGTTHVVATRQDCYYKSKPVLLTLSGPHCSSSAVFSYAPKEFYGTSMAFDNNGTRMLTASNDSLFLWDLTEGELLSTFTGHSGACKPIGFSHNGIYFFSFGLMDSSIRIWEAASGSNVKTYKPYLLSPSAAARAPDGRTIIAGYRDGTLLSLNIGDAMSVPKNSKDESDLSISCVPNPITHSSIISFRAERREPVKIELYNAMGAKVSDLFEGIITEEEQTLLLAESVRLQLLPSGVYLLTITTPQQRKSLVLYLVR